MAEEKKKKSKKIYFIVFIVLAIFLLLILYYFVAYKEAKAPAAEISNEENQEEDNVKNTEDNNENSNEIDTSNWFTYENEEYGFSLRYPKEWGKLNEENVKIFEGSKIYKSILLSSKGLNQYIQIQIVKTEDENDPSIIDYPQKYITRNNKYLLYYSSSNDCVGMPDCEIKELNTDIERIIDTFKLNP